MARSVNKKQSLSHTQSVRAQLAVQCPKVESQSFRNSAWQRRCFHGLRYRPTARLALQQAAPKQQSFFPRRPWLTADAGSAASSRLEQQPCIMTLLGFAWLYESSMKKRPHAREEIEVDMPDFSVSALSYPLALRFPSEVAQQHKPFLKCKCARKKRNFSLVYVCC